MCTLSVFCNEEHTIITMNRDERRTRIEKGDLRANDTYCFPVDISSQGTWIGMSKFGLVFALLNRYQDGNDKGIQQSRGNIIPDLLSSIDLKELQERLKSFTIRGFNPFDLLVIDLNSAIHSSWDGEQLKIINQNLDNPFFISSSSERAEDIMKYRRRIFKDFLNQGPPQKSDILSGLHLKAEKGLEKDSIFMAREKVHTKSITQVLLKPDQSQLFYWPESIIDAGTDLSYGKAIKHSFCSL